MSVESAQANATATLVSAPGKVFAAVVRATAVAGTMVLRDGGPGGSIKATLDTPAAVGPVTLPIPGGGIQFNTDIHVTLTNADGVTIIYEDFS